MVEYKEENFELESFDDRFDWFLNNEISRIECDTVEQRDSVLDKMNARIGSINNVGKSRGKLVLLRDTDQENIFVEDIVDPNDWSKVSWLIYRTDLEDDN